MTHIDVTPDYKPGDQPPDPSAYTHWHAWADVQYKSGLRQGYCGMCCKWLFPQVDCGHDKSQRSTPKEMQALDRQVARELKAAKLHEARQMIESSKPKRRRLP